MAATTLVEVAQHVLVCMCSALTETAIEIDGQPGCPCRSGTVPGSSVLVCCPDKGCATGGDVGQLTVHVARMFRTSNFPQQDFTDLSCRTAAKTLAAELVVTLVRCIPIVDDRGKLPTMDAQSRAAEIQFIDMMTLETAAECCVPSLPGRRKPLRVAVSDHRTIGPTGPNGPGGVDAKCAGSELRLIVALGAVCCPEVPS